MTVNAEQKLIAICTFTPDLIREATTIVEGHEFRDHRLELAWDIMIEAQKELAPIGPTEFHETIVEAGIRGIGPADLWAWRDAIYNDGHTTVERLAKAVRREYVARKREEIQLRYRDDHSPESVSKMIEELKALNAGGAASSLLNGMSLREVLDLDDDYDWLIEGLMERGDRLMLTGGEGAGKSTFVRQMAICLAAGIHPFKLTDIPPLKVLVIDAENSEKQWKRAAARLTENVLLGEPAQDPRDNLHLVCSTRIDVTRESHIGAIHRKIDEIQPDIIFIGPLYKITSRAIQTDDEAAPVLAALDSIRARGLAMVIEAHAGHTTTGDGARNLRPRGSSAILGWPEFGIGLALDQEQSIPEDGGAGFKTRVVNMTRWRGDRDVREWPNQLTSSGPMSWNAYDEGYCTSRDRLRFTVGNRY